MGDGNAELYRTDGMSLDRLPRWLRDLIELNDELADRDNGRMKRLNLVDENGDPRSGRKTQRKFDELLRLLQNPAYMQLYREAAETIQRIDDAADRAKQKLAKDAQIAAAKVEALRINAAELPDGRKVFRAKNGHLIAEDGTDVTTRQESIKGLSLRTSGWEEFRDAQMRLVEIQHQQREIDDYMRNVIDPVRYRLADPENPMAPDELREFKQKAQDEMPAYLRAELESPRSRNDATEAHPASNTAADEYVGPSGLTAPELLGQFKAASTVIGDDAFAPPSPDAAVDSEIAQTREPYGSQATKSPARTPKT